MNCPYCHKPVREGESFCTYCGKSLKTKKEHKRLPKQFKFIFVVLLAAVVVYFGYQHFFSSSYPKGMYVMYNTNGDTIASLTLKEDGSYILQDEQNYSSYDEVPEIVFHHDYEVGNDGLTWDDDVSGKIRKTEASYCYMIEDFLGGLFTPAEDVYLYYADDVIYIYPCSSEGTDAYVFVRP